MANTVRVGNVGVYVQKGAFDSINVTNVGVYVQLNEGGDLRVGNVGVYVQQEPKKPPFQLVYKSRVIEGIRTVKLQQLLSIIDATTIVNTSSVKLPNLPTWSLDITGFFYSGLPDALGNLGNQNPSSVILTVTDRFGESIRLLNTQSFVTKFTLDVNIDNVLTYTITIVGSDVLTSQNLL